MDEVEALGMQLDRPSATLLVSQDGERYFLAEATLVAVALYLLKKYADGYLKGLGLTPRRRAMVKRRVRC